VWTPPGERERERSPSASTYADVKRGTLLKWILNAAKPLNPIQFFLFPTSSISFGLEREREELMKIKEIL